MTISYLNAQRMSKFLVSRIYLLNSQTIVRFYLRNGNTIDAPISSVKEVNYTGITTTLLINVNNVNLSVYLNKGMQVELSYLFAITRPDVFRIDSPLVSQVQVDD